MCERETVRVCVRLCVCERESECVCVSECVRACVRARVRARAWNGVGLFFVVAIVACFSFMRFILLNYTTFVHVFRFNCLIMPRFNAIHMHCKVNLPESSRNKRIYSSTTKRTSGLQRMTG